MVSYRKSTRGHFVFTIKKQMIKNLIVFAYSITTGWLN